MYHTPYVLIITCSYFFFLIGNVHLKETISVLDMNVRFERTENTVKNSLTLICLGI